MKKTDIKVGETYTDGKGNQRHVLAEGADHATSAFQSDQDCVRYRVTAKKSGPNLLNGEYSATRTAFASWAKAKVSLLAMLCVLVVGCVDETPKPPTKDDSFRAVQLWVVYMNATQTNWTFSVEPRTNNVPKD